MRLYDFRCSDCDRVFEELVGAGEQAPCPSCGSTHVIRQLSAFSIGRSSSGGARSAPEPSTAGGGFGGGCAGGMCGL